MSEASKAGWITGRAADGDVHVALYVAPGRPYDEAMSTSSASPGPTKRWRLLLVSLDGEVRALDLEGRSYTRHHDLTDEEQAQARAVAGVQARSEGESS